MKITVGGEKKEVAEGLTVAKLIELEQNAAFFFSSETKRIHWIFRLYCSTIESNLKSLFMG